MSGGVRQSAAECGRDQRSGCQQQQFSHFQYSKSRLKTYPPPAAAKLPSRVDNALRAGIMSRPRIWAYFQASKLSTTILYSGPHTLMLEAPLSRPNHFSLCGFMNSIVKSLSLRAAPSAALSRPQPLYAAPSSMSESPQSSSPRLNAARCG